MDGHGEQPGPNPGGGAGRSENLQGGGPEEGTEHTGVTFLSLLMWPENNLLAYRQVMGSSI